MLTRELAVAPVPEPTPFLVEVVAQATPPIWVGPLLTGVFVLAAAGIALLSLYWSDRRKLAREDRRQWDADLRATYVTILEALEPVERALLFLPAHPQEEVLGGLRTAVWDASETVRRQIRALEVVAPQPVIEAARGLYDALTNTWADAIRTTQPAEGTAAWRRTNRQGLDDATDHLRVAVRSALRVHASSKPTPLPTTAGLAGRRPPRP